MKLTISKSKKLFENYLNEVGYKANTIRKNLHEIAIFFTIISTELEVTDIRNITEKTIRSFLVILENMISKRKQTFYSKRSKNNIFLAVKIFFKSLYIKEEILFNPVLNIKYNPTGIIKDKSIFTVSEISSLLDSIDGKDYISRRDRTLFELMYSSGLRAGEVANIKKSDINIKDSLIHVRLGKFGKDRIVPVSETAILFLKRFTSKIKADKYIFVSTCKPNKLGVPAINTRLKKYLSNIKFKKEGLTSHSIRHSTATHLLDRGADLRYVQALLGHESIETTVIYTHLLSDSMKKIYKSHHPRENGQYEEVNNDYLNDISELETSILNQREIREKKNRSKLNSMVK